MPRNNAQRKPDEPFFDPNNPTYEEKTIRMTSFTGLERTVREDGKVIRGLSARERARLRRRKRARPWRHQKNWILRSLRSLLFYVSPRYSTGIVQNSPFDESDYAFRSNYGTTSINDALQIEIENSSELASYPSISKRLSTLIQLESSTKSHKLIKVPVFPDWENDIFTFIQERCVVQLANPRDVQIFAEKHFGLSVTLHPANNEYEFALVANVHPGKISKGFALVDSSQESDLSISISILRALATFLFADAPVSIGKFGFHLEDLTEEIVHYVTSNHLKSESDNRSDFTSKRVLSPYLEASVLKAFSMEEVDISLVANELYEVSDINALEGHLRKSGWGK
jgi:hypothetical protein